MSRPLSDAALPFASGASPLPWATRHAAAPSSRPKVLAVAPAAVGSAGALAGAPTWLEQRGGLLAGGIACLARLYQRTRGRRRRLYPGPVRLRAVEEAKAENVGEANTAVDINLHKNYASSLNLVRTMDGQEVRACRKGAKQVATVGPASYTKEMLERLFLAGVDVFRLNFSHGKHSEKAEMIKNIRAIEKQYAHPIGILADIQGPKLRCGDFEDPEGVLLTKGHAFTFRQEPVPGNSHEVQLPHREVFAALKPGKMLYLDDGKIKMVVEKVEWRKDGEVVCTNPEKPPEDPECFGSVSCVVLHGGWLSSRKGVNTPDTVLPLSAITPKDKVDVEFAVLHGVDWIAVSFVQSTTDMTTVREVVQEVVKKAAAGGEMLNAPRLIVKVEKPVIVNRPEFQKLLQLQCVGAVMVARGDLGVEMGPERVPIVQKRIIQMAHSHGKPVIVATQMLESMMKSPTPTRAECSDVANAIFDGCDAVMLSGESAVGQFPLETVALQRRVIELAEEQISEDAKARQRIKERSPNASLNNAILACAETLAAGRRAKAIICFTSSGQSAEKLAHLRPTAPIFALTENNETARRLSLFRGVYAIADKETLTLADEASKAVDSVRFTAAVKVACKIARRKALVHKEEDELVIVARLPLFTTGELNVVRITKARGPDMEVEDDSLKPRGSWKNR